MPRGGKQPGAGRPPGARSKAKITDYMTQEEIDEMVQLFVSQCREKPDLMKFLMEQIFGKARQNIGLDGGEENKPISILTNVIRRDNSSSQDSQAKQENPSHPGRNSSEQNNIDALIPN